MTFLDNGETVTFTPYPEFCMTHPSFKQKLYICIPYDLILSDVLKAGGLQSGDIAKVVELIAGIATPQPKMAVPENVIHIQPKEKEDAINKIVSFIQDNAKNGASISQIAEYVNKDVDEVRDLLRALRANNLVGMVGTKRASRYVPGPAILKATPAPAIPVAQKPEVDSDTDDSDDDTDSDDDSPLTSLTGGEAKSADF